MKSIPESKIYLSIALLTATPICTAIAFIFIDNKFIVISMLTMLFLFTFISLYNLYDMTKK